MLIAFQTFRRNVHCALCIRKKKCEVPIAAFVMQMCPVHTTSSINDESSMIMLNLREKKCKLACNSYFHIRLSFFVSILPSSYVFSCSMSKVIKNKLNVYFENRDLWKRFEIFSVKRTYDFTAPQPLLCLFTWVLYCVLYSSTPQSSPFKTWDSHSANAAQKTIKFSSVGIQCFNTHSLVFNSRTIIYLLIYHVYFLVIVIIL